MWYGMWVFNSHTALPLVQRLLSNYDLQIQPNLTLPSYDLAGTFLIESVSVNSAIGSSPCKDGQVAMMVTG